MIDKIRLDELTREMGWLRGLARALVSTDAEDLAQDAWLIAADEMPADRSMRPWLVRVMGNLARRRVRTTTRRQRREDRSEQGAASRSPAEMVERVELQRLVAGEVVALAEPYRSTLLLHYFEGISSAEIARRQGISDGTVRWRLKAALDRVRARLRDREDAPKGGWLAALAPLATPLPRVKPSVAAATSGSWLVFVLAAVIIAAGVIWQLATSSPKPEPWVSSAPPLTRLYPQRVTRRTGASAPHLDPAKLAQVDAPPRRIAGTVTVNGAPIAGATVRLGLAFRVNALRFRDQTAAFAEPIATVVSDEHGAFSFGERPAAWFVVVASADGHSPVSKSIALADPTVPAERLELALGDCELRMSGRVRDATGGAIIGARVSTLEIASVESSATGDYAICIPARGTVRASADGYAAIEETPAAVGELRRDLVLAPEAIMIGRVVDERDHPIAGARVVAFTKGSDVTTESYTVTDDDGRFEVTGLAPGRYDLVAAARGFYSNGRDSEPTAIGKPGESLLVLSRGARIRGRVVRDGRPVEGVTVNPTASETTQNFAVSQLDGRFVLDGIRYGTVWLFGSPVRLSTGGGVNAKPIVVDRREVAVDIEALPDDEFDGYVYWRVGHGVPCAPCASDPPHGPPVVGATVTCTSLAPVTATTDDTGGYRCKVQAYQRGVRATAVCPDGPPTSRFGQAPAWDGSFDIELSECPTPPELHHVRGVVVDRSGAPMAGVDVEFRGDATRVARTDETGSFEADVGLGMISVYSGKSHRQAFVLDGGQGKQGTVVSQPPSPIRIVVDATPTTATGRVVDAKGGPVSDARVMLRCPVDNDFEVIANGDGASSDLTGPDGHFSIATLATRTPCDVEVFVGVHRAHATWLGSSIDIVVGAPRTVKLEMPNWPDGTLVTAYLADTTEPEHTGEVRDEEVELAGIVQGTYVVTATDGTRRAVESVELGDKDVHGPDLGGASTSPMREIRLVNIDTGKPLAGMACEAAPEGLAPVAVTGADGRVEMHEGAGFACWSARGPWVAALGRSFENTIITSLDRPGTAQPGFVLAPVSSRLVIAIVDAGSSAAVAGLEVGDAIVELDGNNVTRLWPGAVMYLVWTHPRGALRLAVDRDGERRDISIPIRE